MSTPQYDDYRKWYFDNIVAQITDREIRAFAEILNMHYGKENRVEMESMCLAVWGHYEGKDSPTDRKGRQICETLTKVYRFPVGSSAGCSGYWRCTPGEIAAVKHELQNRINTTQARLDAYDLALFPPDEPEIPAPEVFTKAAVQHSLF